jgi:hypothetical protein
MALVAAWPLLSFAEEEQPKIRDNMFLVEEAYNQEPGVIQHIQTFLLDPKSREWEYSFTEEWPLPTDRHQLSVTIPIVSPSDGDSGLADVMINYRLQAFGAGGAGWLAIAPRISLVLPTGSPRMGTGNGGLGMQFNLPVSIELGRYVAAHLNGGITCSPDSRSPAGRRDWTLGASAGIGLVWLALPWFNVLVEDIYTTEEEVLDNGAKGRSHEVIINPGVRFAIGGPGGLQVVPGISMPVRVFPNDEGRFNIFVYLSFEHPLVAGAAGGP